MNRSVYARLIVKTFLSLFLLLSLPQFAVAKPLEVKSENFVFYGDISEKKAISLIESLETYRAVLFSLYGFNPGPEYLPVRIYGFKSQGRIEKITGRDNVGGLYVTTLEGPAFLLNTKGSFSKNSPAYSIAHHEYTHHVLAGFTNQFHPRWYNEGFAEYLSTFEYSKKGTFKIGLPTNGRAFTLAQYDWMPLDVIIRSVRKYPFKKQGNRKNATLQSLFYAQSWLVTHYIQSTPGYAKKMQNYIHMINQPAPPT